jgi:hypothetical protein
MKTNQKGFGAVEVVIVIVVAGLLGFAAWYFWNAQDKPVEQAVKTPTKQIKKEEPKEVVISTIGFQSYEDKEISLKYPAKWIQYEVEAFEGNERLFKSPDFVEKVQSKPMYKSGFDFHVVSFPNYDNQTFESDLKRAPEFVENNNAEYETIEIDGQKAVLYYFKVNNQTYWKTTLYTKESEFEFFMATNPDDKDEAKSTLLAILSTVDLK